MEKKQKFDKQYYDRYYRDPATRATSEPEQKRQAAFIAAYLRYLEVPVSRIVDFGCGLGHLLDAMQAEFPDAQTVGVEYSEYLCTEFKWNQGSVVDYDDEPFDLVICSDVLGYLDKSDCKDAIKNLARLTTSALYLTVLTLEDLDICDQQHTDMSQKLRSYEWYEDRIQRDFVSVGGGMFLKRPLAYPVWRMERL
jgi:trans-aconitate methyltransferase